MSFSRSFSHFSLDRQYGEPTVGLGVLEDMLEGVVAFVLEGVDLMVRKCLDAWEQLLEESAMVLVDVCSFWSFSI